MRSRSFRLTIDAVFLLTSGAFIWLSNVEDDRGQMWFWLLMVVVWIVIGVIDLRRVQPSAEPAHP
jgi:Na+/melibiose symporter-like transporter